MNKKVSSESAVKDIRRRTRKKYSSEEKIRIVIDGLRGEDSISNLCSLEGIPANLYYRWSKDFLEADKKFLEKGQSRYRSWFLRNRVSCDIGPHRETFQPLVAKVHQWHRKVRYRYPVRLVFLKYVWGHAFRYLILKRYTSIAWNLRRKLLTSSRF